MPDPLPASEQIQTVPLPDARPRNVAIVSCVIPARFARNANLGEILMPTTSGHTSAILASKVKGTPVYNPAGEKIGHVEDVVLDKQSDHIMFAALGFGGLLGMGKSYYPVPWSMLDYSDEKDGYVVPISKEKLDRAPSCSLEDLTKHDGSFGDLRTRAYTYYEVPRDW
jgi:sporulation protein YlmC with PRC-barrel domain